jgi:hypothetical protein
MAWRCCPSFSSPLSPLWRRLLLHLSVIIFSVSAPFSLQKWHARNLGTVGKIISTSGKNKMQGTDLIL